MKLMPASLHRSIAGVEAFPPQHEHAPERQRRDKKSVEQHRSRGNSVVDQRQSEQRDQPERRGRKQSQKKAHEIPPYPGGVPDRLPPVLSVSGRNLSAGGAAPPGLALSTLGSRHNGIFPLFLALSCSPFAPLLFRPESQRKKGRPGKSRPSGCFKGAFLGKMPRISGDDGEWRFPFRRDAPYYSELPVLAGSIAKPTAFPFAAAPTLMPGRHFFFSLIEVVIEFKIFLVDLIGPVLNAEDADGGFAVAEFLTESMKR